MWRALRQKNSRLACLSVNTDTIESFPVESSVSYADIQDETSTLRNHESTDPTASDAVLDCDCHVSVRCDSEFLKTTSLFIVHRWMAIAYCVKAGARSGTIFGM